MATVFEADLLQDLDADERTALGEVLTRLLRRVEDAQPDAAWDASPTWTERSWLRPLDAAPGDP